MSARKPIAIGTKFHRLTVIGPAPSSPRGQSRHNCRCDCGEIRIVASYDLRSGGTKSCGCLRKEMAVHLSDVLITHGHSCGKTSPEYKAWQALIQRCCNPSNDSYKNYGARGISVCHRWIDSFYNFYADMGSRPTPKHSIDRYNNAGNYDPENCRWATKKEQLRNTRVNRILKFNGDSLPLIVWAERLGIDQHVLQKRIARGWSHERISQTPVRQWLRRNL